MENLNFVSCRIASDSTTAMLKKERKNRSIKKERKGYKTIV